jgi:hypothetical protein
MLCWINNVDFVVKILFWRKSYKIAHSKTAGEVAIF